MRSMRCRNVLNVLYFPFREVTPSIATALPSWTKKEERSTGGLLSLCRFLRTFLISLYGIRQRTTILFSSGTFASIFSGTIPGSCCR